MKKYNEKFSDFTFLHDEKKHVVCIVGAGGKTTLMYELATYCTQCGKKVVATASTHIYRPDACYAEDFAAVEKLWQQGNYAVIGTPETGTGKLTAPCDDLWRQCLASADIILVEADGAKQKLLKIPAEHEPVILPECDIVIGVLNLDAVGKQAREVCHRYELAEDGFWHDGVVTMENINEIAASDKYLHKNVGTRDYYVVMNGFVKGA